MNRFILVFMICVLLIGRSNILNAQEETKRELSKDEILHLQYISFEAPVYDDLKLAEFVNRVGQKLVQANNLGDHYRFFVLDDPTVNAFTFGNGYIYLNRGLVSLMTSEAQLAAVLAHEIAHNTQRHASRQKFQSILTNIVAIAGAVVVGNSNIADVIQTSAAVRLKGYGREMELESDEVGAEYMYAANYDPEAMLGVLSILKDHERVQDLQSISEGGDATYHGVFASHPRADKRLQEVIAKAGTLPPGESFRGRESMREALEGTLVGPNNNGNAQIGWERFINQALGVTMLYPESWNMNISGAKIVLKDSDQTQQLKITVEKAIDKTKTSREVLAEKFPNNLVDVKAIKTDPAKDLGTTARHLQSRVATVTVGRNSYLFEGISRDNELSEDEDSMFQTIISTFRRATRDDIASETVTRIYYKRLEPGETFASLAENGVMGELTEQQLRLMNGYYPSGEAEPGTWMKLISKDRRSELSQRPSISSQ